MNISLYLTPSSLKDFSNHFYKKLLENEDHLPLKVKSSLKYLISDNWFNLYSTIDGLKRILAQMESRIKYTSKLSESTDKFVSLLSIIEPEFFLFFEDIQKATKTELLKTKYK